MPELGRAALVATLGLALYAALVAAAFVLLDRRDLGSGVLPRRSLGTKRVWRRCARPSGPGPNTATPSARAR